MSKATFPLLLFLVGCISAARAMATRITPVIENMAVSKTVAVFGLVKELESKGETVLSLCVGEPDYQPPEEVVTATGRAAKNGLTKYTAVNGDLALRKAIVADLKKRKGVTYTPDQIVVSNGAKQSVVQALLCTVTTGDEVVVPAPYWTSYPDIVKLCGATPVILDMDATDNYLLKPETLRTFLTSHPRVKGIILCNPSNPTGSVAEKDNLIALAAVLKDFPKVLVLADEIYERLTYGTEHTSFASLPDMFDRTITVNGFSKSHSMTGYRIGYSASATDIAKACSKLQSQLTSCASSIGQEAATVALGLDETWITKNVAELQAKRDLAYKLVTSIPNVSCPKPMGAFYLLPKVEAYFGKKTASGIAIKDADDLCLELLKEEKVAMVSGDAFGAPKCIRLSYATSTDVIEQSLNRLKKFLLGLK